MTLLQTFDAIPEAHRTPLPEAARPALEKRMGFPLPDPLWWVWSTVGPLDVEVPLGEYGPFRLFDPDGVVGESLGVEEALGQEGTALGFNVHNDVLFVHAGDLFVLHRDTREALLQDGSLEELLSKAVQQSAVQLQSTQAWGFTLGFRSAEHDQVVPILERAGLAFLDSEWAYTRTYGRTTRQVRLDGQELELVRMKHDRGPASDYALFVRATRPRIPLALRQLCDELADMAEPPGIREEGPLD